MYTDDMPDPAGCLHAAMVTSSKAHARVTAVDSAAAEAAPGVVAYVSSKDVPASGMNSWGIVSPTEEAVFADSEVLHVGQIIGIVVAETRAQVGVMHWHAHTHTSPLAQLTTRLAGDVLSGGCCV